jgi:hypothetical protein
LGLDGVISSSSLSAASTLARDTAARGVRLGGDVCRREGSLIVVCTGVEVGSEVGAVAAA